MGIFIYIGHAVFPLQLSQRVLSRAFFWLTAFSETGSNLCGGNFSYHLIMLH